MRRRLDPSLDTMEHDVDQQNDQEGREQDDGQKKHASWLALFNFMSKSHIFIFILAIIFSIASGIIVPALAIFLGRMFDLFTSFDAGTISGSELVQKVSTYGIALAGLGAGNGILNAFFFGIWLSFGELQAKGVREKLFDGMLEKDLEWYDMRTAGMDALISRQYTYVAVKHLF